MWWIQCSGYGISYWCQTLSYWLLYKNIYIQFEIEELCHLLLSHSLPSHNISLHYKPQEISFVSCLQTIPTFLDGIIILIPWKKKHIPGISKWKLLKTKHWSINDSIQSGCCDLCACVGTWTVHSGVGKLKTKEKK